MNRWFPNREIINMGHDIIELHFSVPSINTCKYRILLFAFGHQKLSFSCVPFSVPSLDPLPLLHYHTLSDTRTTILGKKVFIQENSFLKIFLRISTLIFSFWCPDWCDRVRSVEISEFNEMGHSYKGMSHHFCVPYVSL